MRRKKNEDEDWEGNVHTTWGKGDLREERGTKGHYQGGQRQTQVDLGKHRHRGDSLRMQSIGEKVSVSGRKRGKKLSEGVGAKAGRSRSQVGMR